MQRRTVAAHSENHQRLQARNNAYHPDFTDKRRRDYTFPKEIGAKNVAIWWPTLTRFLGLTANITLFVPGISLSVYNIKKTLKTSAYIPK